MAQIPLPLDLSVCLIARNEEHNLPRALRSVTGVAREIIVCDTGSSDRTPAIASAAGARVVHSPWQDDFSLARNTAIAAATAPWILMLDADEELVESSVPALGEALSRPVLAQIVHNHLLYPPGPAGPTGPAGPAPKEQVISSLRLFRRHEGVRFRGRVHESLAESLLLLGASEWPDSGVHLHHHGYLDAGERRRKSERNLRLLEQAVAEEPDNLYLGYKLALTLPSGEGPRRKALLADLAGRALALPTAELCALPYLPPLLARAGAELIAAGELSAAARLCQRAAERLGGSLWYSAGKALLHAGSLAAAETALMRYLREAEAGHQKGGARTLVQPDPEATPSAARHLLGQVALLSQHYGPAERLLKEALGGARDPQTFTAIACDLVRVFLRSGRVEAAVAALTDLTGSCPPIPGAPGVADGGRFREVMLLSAEVSVYLGDLAGALPLCQAALDPAAGDDRAAALLATLMLRTTPPNEPGAMALLPILPGTRHDTLAVRLWLCGRFGRGWGQRELPQATQQALRELEAKFIAWPQSQSAAAPG